MDTELATLRRFYDAFGRRDWAAAGECFTSDAVWHLPGRSQIGHRYVGWAAIAGDFFAKLGPLTDGTFKSELVDVLVGERTVIAYQHATGEREGRSLDMTACQVITFRDGLINEVRGHYFDLYEVDAFWA